MNDQRIIDLERQVGDMRVDNARLNGSVDHLANSVDMLTMTVSELRDTMNRGRGALWGMGASATLLGAAASYAATKLFGG